MTTVTANTRLARRLRREFDQDRRAGKESVWESPDILPWRAWVRRLWEEAIYSGRASRVLLSSAQEQVLWEQAIRASKDGSELLNPTGTARVAAEAWRILQDWRLPRQEEHFAGVPDTEAFFEWIRWFQAILKTRGFITEAELPDVVAFTPPKAIAGFDELTPVQRSLFAGAEQVPQNRPFLQSRRQTALLDGEQEVRAAANWARRQLEQFPDASIGIVFPDLSARRTAAARVFREVLGTAEAFHISAPITLHQIPLIAGAILALKLCEGMPVGEAGSLLRSPYFRHTAQEGARADMALRRRGIANVTLTVPEMAALFPGLAAATGVKKPSGWSTTFSELAMASGWPGTRTLSSEEYQAAEAWKNLLSEFSKLDAVLGEMDFGSALARLERLAGDTNFGPEDEDEPVQLMGILESAGARFDALWIGGLHDGAWPPIARPNPFVPLALLRAANAPNGSVEQQYSYAQRVTRRLLDSAEEVICSYPQLEGETALRPSPFLAGMHPVEFAGDQESHETVALEKLEHDDAPPLGEERFVKGGMSVIAFQAACPFRAFATFRLGARGLDEVEPGLTNRERGTITHAALEAIWGALKTQRGLRQANPSDLRDLVQSSVRRALAEKLGEGSRSLTNLQLLETKRLSGILLEWLEFESRRPEFENHEIEMKRRYTLGGVELDIRADRVDRYADGSLAILDYKTGVTSRPTQWESERPEAPQLPLYSILMEEPVSTVAFAQVAAGDLKLFGVSEVGDSRLKPGKALSLKEQIPEWRRILEALARDFGEGRAAVDPTPKACEFCGLAGLCRVNE